MASVHFSVEGSFVTEVAREKLFVEKDLASAIRILRGALDSDQIDSDEQLMIALQVLHGSMWIKGNSGDGTYGLETRDDLDERPTNLSSIAELISGMAAEIKSLQEERYRQDIKMNYICHELQDYQLDKINAEYYNEEGEPLFEDREIPDWAKTENQLSGMDYMLSSYLEQRRNEEVEMQKAEEEGREPECDYGWLEPDGTWHPVEWGRHPEFARDWLEEHYPSENYPELYCHTDSEDRKRHIENGDVLVFSLGWVLLDSPYQGLAKATHDPAREFTKAQKEFLYDYYIKRGRNEEANKLYED